MISRRILVGIVAALGLFLLNWRECGAGFQDFRYWAIARLAEWDASRLRVESIAILVEPDLASFEAARIAIAPARTADSSGRADEDSRERRVSPPADEPVAIVGRPPDAPDDPDESIQAMAFCKFTEVSPPDEALPGPSAVDRGSQEADAPVASIPDDPPAGRELAEVGSPSDVRPLLPAATTPAYELIEPSDETSNAIAGELNRLADGVAVPPDFRAFPTARRPDFEPIVPPDDSGAGLAYELNRASEGLQVVPPNDLRAGRTDSTSTDHPGQPPLSKPDPAWRPLDASGLEPLLDIRGGTLGRAVRITGDAARAWMDVLAGPMSEPVAFRFR